MSIELGIDLGTTNTVVAAVINGRAVVVNFRNLFYIPSVVCNDRTNTKSIKVGDEAKAVAETNQPEDTIYSIKRLMGARFYSKDEQFKGEDPKERERFLEVFSRVGYVISEAPGGKDHGARVVLGDKHYKPEEISAMILTCAKEAAEEFFGDKVGGVVITVPAYFEERQRAATVQAGVLAGLTVKALLDEPTAAAIAVGLAEKKGNRHVLVFDLGGGTFDVSLLQVMDNRFRVKNIGGNNWLGGDNFDYKLLDVVADHIKRQYHGYDPRNDKMFRAKIKPYVEEAKKALSDGTHTTINVPNLGTAPPAPGQSIGRIMSVANLRITRSEFEGMIADSLKESLEQVDLVLKETDILPENIDEVLLIGGSTYIPCIRDAMEKKFPNRVRTVEEVDPMRAVAQGAAFYANSLTGIICPNCKSVNPDDEERCTVCKASLKEGRFVANREVLEHKSITERSIGIAIRDGKDKDVFQIIIPKGEPYPMDKPITHPFIAVKPNRVFIPVYAGESRKAGWNKHHGNIVVDLKGREVTKGTPVTVGLRYDENRIMQVIVTIEGRDPEVHKLEYGTTTDEWLTELDESIRRAEHFLDEYEPYIPDRQRELLQKSVDRAKDALESQNQREAERVTDAIHKHIYFSDTLASLMHTADRLTHDPRIKEGVRAQLRQLVQLAKEAKIAGKEDELLDLQNNLEVANAVAMQGVLEDRREEFDEGLLARPGGQS